MDKETQRRLAEWRLASAERQWRDAKTNGEESDDLRRRLSQARSDYRARWRQPPAAGVSPGPVSLKVTTNTR